MSRIAGLGMDLIDLDRVRHALQKNGEAFALRICTPDEWAYCRKHADPVPRLAARFAAKEALVKALGTGFRQGSFQEISVVDDRLGKPEIYLSGQFKLVADQLGVRRIFVSLSHVQSVALAQVVLEK